MLTTDETVRDPGSVFGAVRFAALRPDARPSFDPNLNAPPEPADDDGAHLLDETLG